jgi:hypothetical protein
MSGIRIMRDDDNGRTLLINKLTANNQSSGRFSKGSQDWLINPTTHSRDILRKAKGDHLDRVHLDQKVLKMISGEAGSCYWRPKVSKPAQGTFRHESTQIRWFLWWPGGRLVCVNGGWTQGLHYLRMLKWEWENKTTISSQEPNRKTGRVTAETKVYLLFLVGFWWRGSCCHWRWWWMRTNQASHMSRRQQFGYW